MTSRMPSRAKPAMIPSASARLSRSRTSRTTGRPSMPPSAFTMSTAMRTPVSSGTASARALPVIGNTAPIRIGWAETAFTSTKPPTGAAMASRAIPSPRRDGRRRGWTSGVVMSAPGLYPDGAPSAATTTFGGHAGPVAGQFGGDGPGPTLATQPEHEIDGDRDERNPDREADRGDRAEVERRRDAREHGIVAELGDLGLEQPEGAAMHGLERDPAIRGVVAQDRVRHAIGLPKRDRRLGARGDAERVPGIVHDREPVDVAGDRPRRRLVERLDGLDRHVHRRRAGWRDEGATERDELGLRRVLGCEGGEGSTLAVGVEAGLRGEAPGIAGLAPRRGQVAVRVELRQAVVERGQRRERELRPERPRGADGERGRGGSRDREPGEPHRRYLTVKKTSAE